MGIPFIRRALQKLMVKRKLKSFDIKIGDLNNVSILSIDGMAIVHPVVAYAMDGKAVGEDFARIIALVKDAFREIVRSFTPGMLLIVALDGPPPFAKIRQQKQRRYNHAMQLKKLPDGGMPYDSNVLTPGTDLLFALDAAIYDVLAELKRDLAIPEVIYRGQLTPGEGEHKIMKELHNWLDNNQPPEGANIIYGNDSDLILLGLALDSPHVYIVRDAVALRDGRIPYTKVYDTATDIDALGESLTTFLEGSPSGILDFIASCSLLGNDFLPRSPIFSNIDRGLELLMEALKKVSFINNMNGFFRFLAAYEDFDGELEEYNMSAVYRDYEAKSITKTGFVSFQSRIFDILTEANDVNVDNFVSLWYQQEFGHFEDKQLPDVAKMCMQYRRGLFWIMSYYLVDQDAVTWLWYYPYDHAPLFTDMMLTFPVDGGAFSDSVRINDVSPLENEQRPTPFHQQLAVMPQHSLAYVAKELRGFYATDGPLRSMMPVMTIDVDYDMIEADYQSIVIVPDAVPHVIYKAIAGLTLTESVIDKYSLQPMKGHVMAASGVVRSGRGGGSQVARRTTTSVAPRQSHAPRVIPRRVV